MTREVNQRELRNDSGKILQAAERGESFVITRNGTPVARLLPFERENVFVAREELKRTSANLPRIDFQRLRDDFDDAIDQDPFHDPYEQRD